MSGDRYGSAVSSYLVDADLLPFLDQWPALTFSDSTIAGIRKSGLAAAAPAVEPGVKCREVQLPGADGKPGQRLLVLTPDGLKPDAPAVFYVHGGGYVMGRPEETIDITSRWAKQCRCVFLLPSYRLAPEAPWPAAVEDLHSALTWVHDHARELGIISSRIAVAGTSAGGGHAAALTLHVRKHGGPPIAFQILMCPMLDDRQPANPFPGEFVWTRDHDRYGWASLLGREPGGTDIAAEAVPGRVQDLSALPPAYIQVGALDLFVEASIDYARRLMAGGVATELHVYPGLYHGGELLVREAAISQAVMADIENAIQTMFERHAPAMVAG